MTTLSETAKSVGRLVRHAVGAAMSPVRAGASKLVHEQPALAGHGAVTLQSDSFQPLRPIPRIFSAEEGAENLSPTLSWSGVPAAARSIAIICEDPDAPQAKPFVHWMIWNIPADITMLPQGLSKAPSLTYPAGAIQGENSNDEYGYSGPVPPVGHGVHHYHFQLFALDGMLDLGPGTTREVLVEAMKGRVLAQGEVVGTYERRA